MKQKIRNNYLSMFRLGDKSGEYLYLPINNERLRPLRSFNARQAHQVDLVPYIKVATVFS